MESLIYRTAELYEFPLGSFSILMKVLDSLHRRGIESQVVVSGRCIRISDGLIGRSL